MKKRLSILLLFISGVAINAQTAQFSWLSGATFTNQISVMGTKGVPSPTNIIGARQDAQYWNDNQNNLYVLGGYGIKSNGAAGDRNDLWKYNLTTGESVWLTGSNPLTSVVGVYGTKGVASTTNTPGSRYGGATWMDNNGDLWLFGGYGAGSSGSGNLQDLWKYSVVNNTWMWVSGATTPGQFGNYVMMGTPNTTYSPGPRYGAVSWVDNSGNLWLFGGYGQTGSFTLGYLNDLWKFDIVNSTWTWVSGSSVPNTVGGYGTKGVASSSNSPSSRHASVYWTDNTGNFWLFGGFGKSSTTTNGELNDLWKYNTTTNQWTWMTGSNLTGGSNVGGIMGAPSTTNTPGARMNSAGWADGSNLWLFGGGPYSSGAPVSFNDLWMYNIINNTWVWVSGTSASNTVTSVYGTQNVLSPSNVIGSREQFCTFKDMNGDFILFGGRGYAATNTGYLNDFWKIKVCYTNYAVNTTAAINQTVCPNQATILSASGVGTLGWYSAASGGTYMGGGTTLSVTGPTANTTYYVQDSTCGAGPRTSITLTINPAPAIAISGTNTVCAFKTATLIAIGTSTSYTWSTNQTVNNIIVTPSVTTTYTLVGTAANSCTNSAVKTITVNALPTLTVSGNPSICKGSSTNLLVSGANTYTWSNASNNTSITISPTVTTTYSVSGTDLNNCKNTAIETVTVNALPTLTVSSSNPIICTGVTVTVSVLGATSYTWSDNSNGSTMEITPTTTTSYTVTGSDNVCQNTAVFTQSVSLCTGVENRNADENIISVFPNPNNGEFTIQSQKLDIVTITNELGQVIQTVELNQQNNFSYKVNDLQNGIYFLLGKSFKQKVIVTH